MTVAVKIIVDDLVLAAELFDTECARAITDALPLDARPNVWGDEFYFQIPVHRDLDETATTTVSVGDIGYWPPGSALAIFFGPTPLSSGNRPVPASEVNLVGRIRADAAALRGKKKTTSIRIERALET